MKRYTTWGSVARDCGHLHLTKAAAEACLTRHQTACAAYRPGAYSDRVLRSITRATLADCRQALDDYDVTVGPQ
jgi:hypothetical protein